MFRNKLIPVTEKDIELNAPLTQSIYDTHGRLLLRRGLVVETSRYLEHLLMVGMKEAAVEGPPVSNVASVEPEAHSTFEQMENIAARLSRQYQRLSENPLCPEFIPVVGKLAEAILQCCEKDGDASFAMPHLDRHHAYETIHHLMAATVCARVALSLDWDSDRCRSAVAAVLTQDIALFPHRRTLEVQAKLTAGQQAIINSHPEEGACWLERLGVRDAAWLQCVRQHHRRLDGSGYPAEAAGAICMEARISALADAFSAMLRPRPYRGRIPATRALADLYANLDGRYDSGLVNFLIREVGIFPPGSVVKLVNGDTGIVVRNHPGMLCTPEVWSLADGKGHLLLHPKPRDAGDPAYSIVGPGKPEVCYSVMQAVAKLWDTAKPKADTPIDGMPSASPEPESVPSSPFLPLAPAVPSFAAS